MYLIVIEASARTLSAEAQGEAPASGAFPDRGRSLHMPTYGWKDTAVRGRK